MKNILFIAFLFLVSSCNNSGEFLTHTNEDGEIKVFVCSRGCYQYLLAYNGEYYHPISLPENLKEDGIKVVFSGTLQDTETAIKKPAPNDVPIFDFNAQDIKLTSIEEK